MVFNSVDECISYIENTINECMPKLSIEIKRIIDDVTRSQVRGWSGQIFSSVEIENENFSASAYFSNNGNWFSLVTGSKVNNPIVFLEAGTTWGRGATNIIDVALEICEKEIPQEFLRLMKSKGIPMK